MDKTDTNQIQLQVQNLFADYCW